MTRIVAGLARGRRLRVPPGESTRPTSDRVREALFSALESHFGGFDGLRVLDLYAGTGALGLEALSRGAAAVTLVESASRAARIARENVTVVGLSGAEVVQLTVDRFLRAGAPSEPYELVLADPPYSVEDDRLFSVLAELGRGWLAADAVVVVERDVRSGPVRWPPGLAQGQERVYGRTVLWYGHSARCE